MIKKGLYGTVSARPLPFGSKPPTPRMPPCLDEERELVTAGAAAEVPNEASEDTDFCVCRGSRDRAHERHVRGFAERW